MAKERPLHKANFSRPGAFVLFDNFSARDICGHQVRRKLDAIEAQVQCPRERTNHERLCQTRDALKKTVAAAE
jgi:hypothetical protein